MMPTDLGYDPVASREQDAQQKLKMKYHAELRELSENVTSKFETLF